MSPSEPTVDVRRPPREFDALIDWFERVSYRLVLLEEYPLDALRSMVRAVDDAVADHCRIEEPLLAAMPVRTPEERTMARVLSADHAWFRTSTEQLDWFLSVVVGEDHGGNRQALGQYGRILAESLRRHRADEVRFANEVRAHGRSGPTPAGQS